MPLRLLLFVAGGAALSSGAAISSEAEKPDITKSVKGGKGRRRIEQETGIMVVHANIVLRQLARTLQ